jgi:hypothetical protein
MTHSLQKRRSWEIANVVAAQNEPLVVAMAVGSSTALPTAQLSGSGIEIGPAPISYSAFS